MNALRGPLPAIPGYTFAQACRTVMAAAHRHGAWVYQAFDWMNHTYFADALPVPLIQIAITPWGGCLGHTASDVDRTRPPVITLHPSLWGAAPSHHRSTRQGHVWGIPERYLGPRLALDVLVHELVHVSVEYRLGGRGGGRSSHNNPAWVAEVNRLAPLLGLPGVRAAMSTLRREGKQVRRWTTSNIPFGAVARFPHAVRELRGELAYYLARAPLPFERETEMP
jgi:hypothetical protein